MKKESALLDLFFNEPSKQWHFEELRLRASISKPQGARWLRLFQQQGIILRVKQRGKMPYYIANVDDPRFRSRKQVEALNILERSGFLSHLAGLKKVKAVFIFGSMTRWDWYRESDVDVFIYGNPEGFTPEKYRHSVHHKVESFIYKNVYELKRIPEALLRNIITGLRVQGSIDFVEVTHAKES